MIPRKMTFIYSTKNIQLLTNSLKEFFLRIEFVKSFIDLISIKKFFADPRDMIYLFVFNLYQI